MTTHPVSKRRSPWACHHIQESNPQFIMVNCSSRRRAPRQRRRAADRPIRRSAQRPRRGRREDGGRAGLRDDPQPADPGQFDREGADPAGGAGDEEPLPRSEVEQVQRLVSGRAVRRQGRGLLRARPGRGRRDCPGRQYRELGLTERREVLAFLQPDDLVPRRAAANSVTDRIDSAARSIPSPHWTDGTAGPYCTSAPLRTITSAGCTAGGHLDPDLARTGLGLRAPTTKTAPGSWIA